MESLIKETGLKKLNLVIRQTCPKYESLLYASPYNVEIIFNELAFLVEIE